MVADILGIFFVLAGGFFSSVGVLGVLRFPDVYSKLHASGKVSALGIIGILFGLMFLMPSTATALKIIVLGAFMVVAAPVTSHAIAAAVHRREAIERRSNGS